MNLLIVGIGAGSWQMRGVQVGRALGARVTASPSDQDWRWADLVVLVKRAAIQRASRTVSLSVPVVWDALDFWEQPEQNGLSREAASSLARQLARRAGVTQIIGATHVMASDLGGGYLPHHCRLGLRPTAPRRTVETVGYDGTPKYLGAWRAALESSCERRGLRFVVNPANVSDVDVLVSFRDGRWDGPLCRAWKSGVKYVNAIVAGRPVLTQECAAFHELGAVGEIVSMSADLDDALDAVLRLEVRERAYEAGVARADSFTVTAVAATYRGLLAGASRRAA